MKITLCCLLICFRTIKDFKHYNPRIIIYAVDNKDVTLAKTNMSNMIKILWTVYDLLVN